jgi:hypothetical protein
MRTFEAAGSSVANHHFGVVDAEHIEVHENLAQVVLRPCGADGPGRCARDRRRLPIPGAVAVGARRPVNRILQHAGHGVIVFRRHKQHGVRLAYPPLQLRDFGGRVVLLVLVKDWDAVKCERFKHRSFGHECGGGTQGGAVVRFASQAACDAENVNGLVRQRFSSRLSSACVP